ncbi:nitroreductase family protein [Mycobacterium sp. MUNTM1]
MSELGEIIRRQRACRRFDPAGVVSDADIETMLEAAVHAPSAENSQPWVFVVVREQRTRAALAAWWSETWNAGGGDFVKQRVNDKLLVADFEYGMAHGGFAAAPVVVVIGADNDRVPEIYAGSSIYPAAQNFLLTAADLGYGACLTTGLTTFGVEQVRELTNLPATVMPMAAVYLGIPARRLSAPRRRPATSVTYREEYGKAW